MDLKVYPFVMGGPTEQHIAMMVVPNNTFIVEGYTFHVIKNPNKRTVYEQEKFWSFFE